MLAMGTKLTRSKFYAVIVIFTLFLLISLTAHAQAEVAGPGWLLGTAQPVSPAQARSYYSSQQKQGLISPLSATTASPEITELARALGGDPKLIYDYVHNHIDYVPYYGSLKGATLTYLDGSGNDFDQASLMISLLRVSGYTAQYVYGRMTIPGADLANWLGVDLNANAISRVIGSGGIPGTVYPDGHADVDRVWVKANIGGTDYLFDPAFKPYAYTAKIDIGTAMGYNQTDLMNASTTGATITTDYAQHMNETNLRNKLTAYSTNLVSALRSQYPNSDVKDIISGREIIQSNLSAYTTTLPYSPTVTYTWDDIPSAYIATMRIQHEGIDYTFNIPDLSGKRLTLTYNPSFSYRPEILQDGTLIAYGTGTTLGSKNNFTITINHPYAANSGTYMDQTSTYTPVSGSSYAIVSSFGGISDMVIQKRQKQLDSYVAQGLANTSEAVLGETLNIMGLTWLKEVKMTDRLLSALADTVSVTHHMVGLMAQEAGYYIDVRTAYSSIASQHNVDADWLAHFKTLSLVSSAFEHGMLEQLMGSTHQAASTMKLFQIANSTGRKVFYATQGNFETVVWPQLTGYSSNPNNPDDLNTDRGIFRQAIRNGNTLILPDNGQLVLNHWKGEGYISKQFTENSGSMGMIIGGGYFGGYAGDNSPAAQVPPNIIPTIIPIVTTNANDNSTPTTTSGQVNPSFQNATSHDPVDMASGIFLFDSADLKLGGSAPLGLEFGRSYRSSPNYAKRTLGYGWSHNYDIYLTPTSHGDPGLGMRQPVEAASFIAALYVNLDLMKNRADDIQGWMTASLASKWAVDQVIDNAITVNLGKKVMEFIKVADGTYASPPGITTQLVNNSTFSLVERFGTVTNFINLGTVPQPDYRISTLTDVDGNTMTFTYTGNNLTTVQDAFNRTLTLHYDGAGRISSVSDSASPSRSVSYGYDANSNLTTYTDPETKVWSYGYDTNHRMTSLKDPLNVTTATNTYDSLGRVNTQTVPRQGNNVSATYNFYFSGFMNSEQDPSGNEITYYYDDKGREIGKVDALGHMWAQDYDGQNHVVWTQDPRTNETDYTYDGQQNLKKIRNSLLLESNLTYDALLRLSDIIDPLLHGTHVDYDSEHHPISSKYGIQYDAGLSPTDAGKFNTGATYYANGLTYTATDGRGKVTTLTYNGYGNPQTKRVGAHPQIAYTFDPVGRMTYLTDQVNSSTHFVYDKRSILTRTTDPLNKDTIFVYDDAGRPWTKTDRNSNMITYSYTPTSKIDTITYPSSTVTFTYNNLDQLTQMQDSVGTSTYTYYPDSSLKDLTDANNIIVSYKYDEAGNLIEIDYPNNKKVTYVYDALNRLATVTNWLNQTATYNYDSAGRLTGLTNFNGTVTTYGYDNANRLTSLQDAKSDINQTIISSYQFTLNGNGSIIQSAQTEPLAASAPGSGTTSYTYNIMFDRLLTAGSNSFGYDFEGQLNSGYGANYTFDYEHRLTVAGTNQYYYDGAGNRLKAIRNGVTTKYIYDAAGNLLAEADTNNVITKYYIYGAGLLAMVTPGTPDQVYCYHYNAVGSTVALTDSSQNMVNKYAYDHDSFGTISTQQEAVPQPFKFVGRFGVMTEPNGFYYMRARYYDPNVGRFVSEDPLGFDGGDVNLMAYVGNQPVNGIDPFGLCSTQPPLRTFLSNTALYSGTVATGLAISGIEPAATVFYGLAGVAKGIEIGMYSEQPIIDTVSEIGKIYTRVKEPFNILTDWVMDQLAAIRKNFKQ